MSASHALENEPDATVGLATKPVGGGEAEMGRGGNDGEDAEMQRAAATDKLFSQTLAPLGP